MEPRRRLAAGLAGAALVLIAIGVAALVFDASFANNGGAGSSGVPTASAHAGTPAPSPSPSPTPSASRGSGIPVTPSLVLSPSPVVSASPSGNSARFIKVGDGFVYNADDGTQVPVPLVPGLGVAINSGRATYFALASNRYGLKTDSYAGEFMPLVTMGQTDGSSAQTGGVVLVGPVISRLVQDRLAAAQSDADRWVVALPIDIRKSSGSPVSVSFDTFGLAGWSNTPRVVVKFAGSLPIVEAVPANGGFHVLVEQLGVTRWQVIDPLRLGLPPDSIDPGHVMNELLVYGSGAPSVSRDKFFDVRAAVGSLMLAASDDVSVSLVVNGSRADLGADKVLTVGDVPVFVASL
jgi:hypothetical protein